MTKRLLALVSLIASVGAVGIYSVNADTTRADLLDAGAGVCRPIPVACEGRERDGGYRTVRTRALLCRSDAGSPGVILPPSLTRHLTVFRPDLCRRLSATCTDPSVCGDDGGDAPEVDDAPACACSPGSGCYVPEDDGGTREAPVGSTLQPGWSGACQPKACGVFATEDGSDPTWPAECPR